MQSPDLVADVGEGDELSISERIAAAGREGRQVGGTTRPCVRPEPGWWTSRSGTPLNGRATGPGPQADGTEGPARPSGTNAGSLKLGPRRDGWGRSAPVPRRGRGGRATHAQINRPPSDHPTRMTGARSPARRGCPRRLDRRGTLGGGPGSDQPRPGRSIATNVTGPDGAAGPSGRCPATPRRPSGPDPRRPSRLPIPRGRSRPGPPGRFPAVRRAAGRAPGAVDRPTNMPGGRQAFHRGVHRSLDPERRRGQSGAGFERSTTDAGARAGAVRSDPDPIPRAPALQQAFMTSR